MLDLLQITPLQFAIGAGIALSGLVLVSFLHTIFDAFK
jgi:hypothetical protein